MHVQQESIFSSGLRSLVRSAFAIFGLFLGFIPVLILLGGMLDGDKPELRSTARVFMAPDAEGKRSALKSDSPLVLQLDIKGLIGDDQMNLKYIDDILIQSQEGRMGEGRVKAIFLKIDTPGGTVVDSDGIYRSLKRFKERHSIPIYAYVDGLCASGGMYIAASADKVYASRTSLIGSVGVLIPPFFNFSQTMEKMGVTSRTVTSGSYKDMMNPTREWAEDEEKNFKVITDFLYERFVELVVENRTRVDRDKLIDEYGAQVYPAPEAVWMGYIDAVEDDASAVLQQLVEDAGIATQGYQVVRMESRSFLGEFFSTANPLLTGKVSHEIQWLPGVTSKFMNQYLYLYTPGL